MKRKSDALTEGLEKWDYLFDGTQTPVQAGWTIATNTAGDSVESIVDNKYRVQAFGTSNMRRNYTYPDAGGAAQVGLGATLDNGITLEWRMHVTVGGGGVPQSNIFIGDDNEIIRVLYNGLSANINIFWTSGSAIYNDNATTMAAWHVYKLVILGTSAQYWVDDVLITTLTRSNTSVTPTKYIRIDLRCDTPGTNTTLIDYLRIRKGTDPTSTLFKNKLTT